MRIKPRLAINLLGVLALGVLTVGWVVLRLVGPGAVGDPMRVVADFASSGGVYTDQEVTYRGVLVGRVGELVLNDDGVDIELVIDPEWRGDIPHDVLAKVQSKSAVGEQFVNLVPAAADDEMLADGDVIPRSSTRLPVDFQQLLKSLDSVLRYSAGAEQEADPEPRERDRGGRPLPGLSSRRFSARRRWRNRRNSRPIRQPRGGPAYRAIAPRSS